MFAAIRSPRSLALLLVAVFAQLGGVQGFGENKKFMIASSPTTGRIAYIKLPKHGRQLETGDSFRTLIDTNLVVPHGIALDDYRKVLFVADPGLKKLVAYDLDVNGDSLEASNKRTIAYDVETRWVAVDGVGNVFFTDEPRSQIRLVSAQAIKAGNKTSDVLYDGNDTDLVSAPGGIATDNFFVYWVNKAVGTQVGTLMRAPSSKYQANTSESIVALTSNAVKCYGICSALNNIFYTNEESSVFGIKRSGVGEPATLSEDFAEPRGCAFDGDSTVYVADKAEHTLSYFASNMQEVKSGVPMTLSANLQGIYDLALYVHV